MYRGIIECSTTYFHLRRTQVCRGRMMVNHRTLPHENGVRNCTELNKYVKFFAKIPGTPRTSWLHISCKTLAYSKRYSGNFIGGLRKTQKNLTQDSQSRGWDSNRVLPAYWCSGLSLEQWLTTGGGEGIFFWRRKWNHEERQHFQCKVELKQFFTPYVTISSARSTNLDIKINYSD